jgi:hypothetical protein
MRNYLKRIGEKLKPTGLVLLGIILGVSWTYNVMRALELKSDYDQTIQTIERLDTKGNASEVPSFQSLKEETDNRVASVVVAPQEADVKGATPPSGLGEIENKIKDKFGDDKIALAVARAESQLKPDNIGDQHLQYKKDGITYGASYGVFQIRYLPGRPTPDKLLDPDFNIEYAYQMYQKGGWSPWSAYTKGTYKKYLN